MRYIFLFWMFILPGCGGPNRKVEKGTVPVDKVETVPTNQFLNTPGKK